MNPEVEFIREQEGDDDWTAKMVEARGGGDVALALLASLRDQVEAMLGKEPDHRKERE